MMPVRRPVRVSRRALLGLGLATVAATGCGLSAPTSPTRPEPSVVPPLPTPIPTSLIVAPPPAAATPLPPRPVDHLRIAVPPLPPDLEPLRDEGEWSRTLLRTIFDPLVVRDAGGRVMPHLAEGYRNVDPLTWRFVLRPRVQFSNGAPVTVEDVRYSIERAADRRSTLPASTWLGTVRRVEILDSGTLHVVTQEPDPLLPARLVLVPIIPREHHRKLGAQAFAEHPVGTGSYRVKEPGKDRLVLEASEGTWRSRSLCRQLTLVAHADPGARVGMLVGGEVDFAYDVALSAVKDLRDARFRIIEAPRLSALIVEIGYLTGGPLLDRRVRQALNYAIDKQALIRQQLAGLGQIVQGQVLAPGVTGYAPAVRAYPYDPDRARALLREAGVAAGTLPLTIDTLGGAHQAVAEAIQTSLNRLGVPTWIDMLPAPVHAERRVRGGRAPLFLFSLSFGQLLDADEVYERYLSSAPPESRRFASAEFDELYQKSRTEVDPAVRARLLDRLARIFHEEAPIVFLVNESAAHALHGRVGGYVRQGDGVLALEHLGVTQ